MEKKFCRWCGTENPSDFAVWLNIRCHGCEQLRLADFHAVGAGTLPPAQYKANWAAVPERGLLRGAVPLAGKIFWWRGEPYLPSSNRESLKRTL